MSNLRISENITMLRRKKGKTQDELAEFLGVTKASVSKWETKQSYPDILLLPQIAAYFNISIDELIGYEPQLSSEQIVKCYQELASDFATEPFDEVVEKSRKMVNKYFSCYPLLVQMVILWINHFMLTQDKEKQNQLLKDTVELCEHIKEGCSDVRLCRDAVALKAFANLALGKAEEVIEDLEPLLELNDFTQQSNMILAQAYQMVGDLEKAEMHSQVTVYSHLLSLVDNSRGMIYFHLQDRTFCETTIDRIQQVIDTYQLEKLHPNTALQFHYQAAVYYCAHNEKEKALKELSQFVSTTIQLIEGGLVLHGDDYFNRVEEWFGGFALKKEAPRDERVVLDSIIPAMEHPLLAILFDSEEYKKLKKKIERKKNEYSS